MTVIRACIILLIIMTTWAICCFCGSPRGCFICQDEIEEVSGPFFGVPVPDDEGTGWIDDDEQE